ncbi:MAG TPA: hypothetical protein VLA36_01765 [Longimicrobiales bacterium]|nr:hypothetical protein [Longimicrobiales bacterium]
MMASRSGLILLGVAALVGCDLPTDAPMVEQRWIVPLDNTGIQAEEFLPDGVLMGGGVFAVAVDSFKAQGTLGELCTACVDGPGPAPAFRGTFSDSRRLPTDVVGAVLETGSVTVSVENGFSFDPLAGGGSVVLTIMDGPGGKVLGQETVSSAMPPGSTVTRGITLAGGSMAPTLLASAEVISPGGQATTIDTAEKLTLSVGAVVIQAAFVTVKAAGRSVELDPADLNVSNIDATVLEHIQSGSLELDILNPFAVALTMDLVIEYPGGTLTRRVDIERAAVSTISLSYTGEEFRSFLGKEEVSLTGIGTVSAAAQPVLLRTDKRLDMAVTMDLTLVTG